ncbi:MAG: DNA topology modulation protein FlaR [Pseudonocardiaceae bacterium]
MEGMQRVAIIGCGGSGKTTISCRLAAAIGTTATHLDAVYYDDEWSTLQPEKFAAVQEELVAADTWVIEGNYAATLPIRLQRATHVIFLDLPATTCLWGIAQRRWRYRGGQHDTTGVYDRITWGFLTYIWGYRREMAPRVRALLTEHADHAQVHIVRSRGAANQLTEQLHCDAQCRVSWVASPGYDERE